VKETEAVDPWSVIAGGDDAKGRDVAVDLDRKKAGLIKSHAPSTWRRRDVAGDILDRQLGEIVGDFRAAGQLPEIGPAAHVAAADDLSAGSQVAAVRLSRAGRGEAQCCNRSRGEKSGTESCQPGPLARRQSDAHCNIPGYANPGCKPKH